MSRLHQFVRADMNTIAMYHINGTVDIQPDKLAHGVFFAADKRVTPDKIIGFGLQRAGETNTGFKWIGLV